MKLDLIHIPDLESLDTPNGRFYDTGSGKYPSITTILGATSDKTGLEQWKLRVGIEVAEKKSKDATKVGSELHLMFENFLQGIPNEGNSSKAKAMFQYASAILRKRLSSVNAIECALYSHSLKVAGRTDLVGLFDGKKSIIDYKSNHGNEFKKDQYITDYKIQTAFYAKAWEEMGLGKIEQGVLLISNVFCCQPVVFALDEYFPLLEKRVEQFYTKVFTNQNFVV